MARKPSPPPERRATVRERLREALAGGRALTLLELSQEASIAERAIPDHLEHLRKSLRRQGQKLVVEPPRCQDCGFAFRDRRRFTRPGRCPSCRSTHLESPRVRLL